MNKPKKITFTTGLLVAAIVLPAPAGAADQNRDQTRTGPNDASHRASTTGAHDGQKITLAPSNIDQRTAEHFTGKDVRGSSGNHIGNVADVIVDRQSGKIVFFAVSRGGVAGIGDTLRLVPYLAIRRATNDDGVTVARTTPNHPTLAPKPPTRTATSIHLAIRRPLRAANLGRAS